MAARAPKGRRGPAPSAGTTSLPGTAAEEDFFAQVFHWSVAELPVALSGTYCVFRRTDRSVDAIENEAPSSGAGISLRGLPAVAARVRDLDGKVWREPTDIPNIGRFTITAGAMIAFLQPVVG